MTQQAEPISGTNARDTLKPRCGETASSFRVSGGSQHLVDPRDMLTLPLDS